MLVTDCPVELVKFLDSRIVPRTKMIHSEIKFSISWKLLSDLISSQPG